MEFEAPFSIQEAMLWNDIYREREREQGTAAHATIIQ
jgi:hypothetical protein